MRILSDIMSFFFGCRHPHDRRSWPRRTAGVPGVYQTCLECGATITYNKIEFTEGTNV